MPKLYLLMNSFSEGMSGGDLRSIEIVKRTSISEVVVVTSALGKEACDKRGLKAKFLVTSNEKKLGNIIYVYFKRLIRALKLVKESMSKDIIYSTSDFMPDVFPAFICKTLYKDAKWIQLIHHLIPGFLNRQGSLLNNFLSYYGQKVSFFFIKRFADIIIVENQIVKDELERKNFDMSKVRENSNGINLDYFENLKAANKYEYEGIFLGRVCASKGVFDLVEIWKEVCLENDNCRLAIIGRVNENTMNQLAIKIREAGLEKNIDLLGYLDDDLAFGIAKSSKVFIFPSHEEGWGIAICEAMACGLPVVAYNLPVYEQIFPDGMIRIEKGDYRAFSSEILRLLNNNEIYMGMSQSAMLTAKKYSWDEVADREFQLFQEVCG